MNWPEDLKPIANPVMSHGYATVQRRWKSGDVVRPAMDDSLLRKTGRRIYGSRYAASPVVGV